MKLKIFIGYDVAEKPAYDTLKYSIEKNTNADITIIPLYHKELRRQGWFQRPWLTGAMDGNRTDLIDQRPFSTEFSHTRFLVPALCNFTGWALFMDCDMLVRCDIKELFDQADDRHAVMCVKHRQEVKKSEKMDGSPQTSYYRKNWSSLVMWNCGHAANRILTKDAVNVSTGGWLHGFSWLDDHQIGHLDDTYNWIEGTSKTHVFPRIIHYTAGGPWHTNYKDVMYADEWWKYYTSLGEQDVMNPVCDFSNLDYGMVGK